MNDSRNRGRKVTRKAGPPEAGQENHVDTPVFQAPDASSNQSAVKAETAGNDNRDAAQGA